jgi:ribosomal protein S18
LSPLAREEAEAWLPRSTRKGRRRQPLPQADLQRLDFKNVDLLLRLVSDSGRLLPRRATGLKPTQQVRRSRRLAVLGLLTSGAVCAGGVMLLDSRG